MTNYAIPAAPGTSDDGLPALSELLGVLLRIEVVEAVAVMETSFGPASPVRVNVVALDGDKKGQAWPDSLLFPRVLVSQLKPSVGQVVLGRLGKGSAKPGKSAPWLLEAPTADDIAVAQRYDAHVAKQAAAAPVAEEPF
ncbi:MAG: hypothetical protein ACO3S5_08325 [Ilumatobacteraceae bacterium]